MAAGDESAADRARAWVHRRQELVCDVAEPWAHGTVLRASRYPTYWDFNVLRVEDEPGIGADELVEAADEALAGLAHRRIDFDRVAAAEPLRAELEARGWRALRLLYMRHQGEPPEPPALAIDEVAYDDVNRLRRRWHEEDFPGLDPGDHPEHAREVALARGARIFAVRDGGEAIAFAQIEQIEAAAEIGQVYVDPGRRSEGLGTALTTAAIAAAGPVADLWISADDEDRPKRLYSRLGFRPVWTSMELTRLP
jgi:ribosomal protein S18 acetylase RimI-like enzyme